MATAAQRIRVHRVIPWWMVVVLVLVTVWVTYNPFGISWYHWAIEDAVRRGVAALQVLDITQRVAVLAPLVLAIAAAAMPAKRLLNKAGLYLLALVFVAFFWNPTGISVWDMTLVPKMADISAASGQVSMPFEKTIVGLFLLAGWVYLYRVTTRNFGWLGIGIVSAVIAAGVGAGFYYDLVNSLGFKAIALIVMGGLSVTFFIGVRSAHWNRSVSGTYQTEDADTEGDDHHDH